MRKNSKEMWQQVWKQVFLLLVTVAVLFPIVWIFSMALDPRNIDKPLTLTLIPPGASFAAFKRVLLQPFMQLCTDASNVATCMTFGRLLGNSLLVALGTSVLAVVLGSSAAYVFFAVPLHWAAGRHVGIHCSHDASFHGNAGSAVCFALSFQD